MFITLRSVRAAAFAASAAMLAPTAYAETLRAESGSDRSLGTIVMQTTAKGLTDSEHSLTLNSQQTLTRAALKLAAGKIDVAVTPPNAWKAMSGGVGPFKDTADQAKALAPNMRSLYAFVAGTFHPVVWGDSGIESWADVKGKRVFIGPPGGSANKQIAGLIRLATGYEPDVDYEAVKIGWGASVGAFQDGQFDVLVSPSAVGSAAITQLGLVKDIRILSLTEEQFGSDAYQAYLADNGGIEGTIPAGSYDGQVNADKEVFSNSFTMLAAVHKDMPEDQAYALTAAFWDNLEANAGAIKILGSVVGTSPFDGNPMQLHPGAVKYFREKGLDVPEHLLGN